MLSTMLKDKSLEPVNQYWSRCFPKVPTTYRNTENNKIPVSPQTYILRETRYKRWNSTLRSLMRIWRRKWQPTPVLLPGESHGGRSLIGYSPWGCKELDTTEKLHFQWEFKNLKKSIGVFFFNINTLWNLIY